MQAREDGQADGGIEGHQAKDDHPLRGRELMEQDDGDCGDLSYGVGFAEDAGAELAPADNRVHNGSDEKDADIAPEDQDRDSGGHQALIHKDEEKGAEQEFVGDGVEILAERGALLQYASEKAVKGVGESRDDKEGECDSEPVLENGGDEEWREANTNDGEEIGCGAKRIPSSVRGICHC